MSKQIVQYIRRGNRIVGCFYAELLSINGIRIGYSLCKSVDRPNNRFNKKFAIDMAWGRAMNTKYKNIDTLKIPTSIHKDLVEFARRCAKYYKVTDFCLCGSRNSLRSIEAFFLNNEVYL